MNRLILLMTIVACLAAASCKPEPPEPYVSVNGHRFNVEVADSVLSQRRGLSGRAGLPDDSGMLFVFSDEAPRTFWMKNCYIPLDIAFMDASGTILNVATMPVEANPARPTRSYDSAAPAKYALEVPGGTWSRIGATAGMTVSFVNVPGGP